MVRIRVDDNGFVLVEGADRVNVIHHFRLTGDGDIIRGDITRKGEDFIAIHTERHCDAIGVEFSRKEDPWWPMLDRPAMRLVFGGLERAKRFLLQFKPGGKRRQFETLERLPLVAGRESRAA